MLETDELGQRKDGSSANSSVHKRGKEGGSIVKMNYLRSSSWPSSTSYPGTSPQKDPRYEVGRVNEHFLRSSSG